MPAAPPKLTSSTRGRSASRRCRWAISGCAQTAHFSPNVIGSACCRWVRPAITVWRCRSACVASDPTMPTSAVRISARPVAHLQDGRGVHDVLRGGAPVRPAAGLARGARQTGDQADHRIADIARAGGKFLGVEVLDPGGSGDRFGRVGRDDAEPRLHPGQRRLDVEHALEVGALVEHRAHRVAAVERAEDRAVGGIGGHGRAPGGDAVTPPRLVRPAKPGRRHRPSPIVVAELGRALHVFP